MICFDQGAIMSKVFSRRRLALLSVAGALSPLAARAQTPPPAMPTPPAANPITSAVASPTVSSSTPPLGQIDKTKPYFLYFQRNLDVPSTKQLRDTLVKLADAEVDNITLVINSFGGLVAPTLHLYNL